jgi:hypothetical protein
MGGAYLLSVINRSQHGKIDKKKIQFEITFKKIKVL